MKSHDWHEEMTKKQSEIVKDFEKKGWFITGINEKLEILMDNRNVEDSNVKRNARIPITPY